MYGTVQFKKYLFFFLSVAALQRNNMLGAFSRFSLVFGYLVQIKLTVINPDVLNVLQHGINGS